MPAPTMRTGRCGGAAAAEFIVDPLSTCETKRLAEWYLRVALQLSVAWLLRGFICVLPAESTKLRWLPGDDDPQRALQAPKCVLWC